MAFKKPGLLKKSLIQIIYTPNSRGLGTLFSMIFENQISHARTICDAGEL